MGRKYGICQKTEKKIVRMTSKYCEQDMSDIKLVKISYAEHIYEID